jgi:hypothetical protein
MRMSYLRQFFNLLENAVKYADEVQYIGISLSENRDHVQIIVEDKGPGIPPEHKSRIFEKLYRIPTGNVHNIKDHGLGDHVSTSSTNTFRQLSLWQPYRNRTCITSKLGPTVSIWGNSIFYMLGNVAIGGIGKSRFHIFRTSIPIAH